MDAPASTPAIADRLEAIRLQRHRDVLTSTTPGERIRTALELSEACRQLSIAGAAVRPPPDPDRLAARDAREHRRYTDHLKQCLANR